MSDAEPEVTPPAHELGDNENGNVGWDQSWEFENGDVPFGGPEPEPQETPELTLRQKIVAALMGDDPAPSSGATASVPVKRVRASLTRQKVSVKGKGKGKRPLKAVKGKKIVKKR